MLADVGQWVVTVTCICLTCSVIDTCLSGCRPEVSGCRRKKRTVFSSSSLRPAESSRPVDLPVRWKQNAFTLLQNVKLTVSLIMQLRDVACPLNYIRVARVICVLFAKNGAKYDSHYLVTPLAAFKKKIIFVWSELQLLRHVNRIFTWPHMSHPNFQKYNI